MRCDECRFYEESEEASDDMDNAMGVCRRYPRQCVANTVFGIILGADDYLPEVCANDWCGEFQSAEGPPVTDTDRSTTG